MPLNFKYPITKGERSEFRSARDLLAHLSGESAGFYLLSTHAFWHGGLHISDDTSGYVFDKRPVRCMASGEVVAYRLNDDYKTSTWGEEANAQILQYSTSFCLVHHAYASPHKRTGTPTAAGTPDKGPQNTLVFYSLYMHLLPYVGYAQRMVIQGTSALAYTRFPGAEASPSSTSAIDRASANTGTTSTATPFALQPASEPVPLPIGTELSVLDEAEWVNGKQIVKLFYVAVSAVPTTSEATLVGPERPFNVSAATVVNTTGLRRMALS
jgi:hypothetical protein